MKRNSVSRIIKLNLLSDLECTIKVLRERHRFSKNDIREVVESMMRPFPRKKSPPER